MGYRGLPRALPRVLGRCWHGAMCKKGPSVLLRTFYVLVLGIPILGYIYYLLVTTSTTV